MFHQLRSAQIQLRVHWKAPRSQMEDTNWIIPAIFGLIILIGAATFAIHMFVEHAKARRNRVYKSLDEHRILNAPKLKATSQGAGPS